MRIAFNYISAHRRARLTENIVPSVGTPLVDNIAPPPQVSLPAPVALFATLGQEAKRNLRMPM
jgi:hypothetical protein